MLHLDLSLSISFSLTPTLSSSPLACSRFLFILFSSFSLSYLSLSHSSCSLQLDRFLKTKQGLGLNRAQLKVLYRQQLHVYRSRGNGQGLCDFILCNTLQHIATSCNTLQQAATHICNEAQLEKPYCQHLHVYRSRDHGGSLAKSRHVGMSHIYE